MRRASAWTAPAWRGAFRRSPGRWHRSALRGALGGASIVSANVRPRPRPARRQRRARRRLLPHQRRVVAVTGRARTRVPPHLASKTHRGRGAGTTSLPLGRGRSRVAGPPATKQPGGSSFAGARALAATYPILPAIRATTHVEGKLMLSSSPRQITCRSGDLASAFPPKAGPESASSRRTLEPSRDSAVAAQRVEQVG